MFHIRHARELDEDFVAVLPLLRDLRFGHPKFVDATFNRLSCLDHRIQPQLVLDVRLHREGIAAVGTRTAIEVGREIAGGIAERGILGRLHPFDPDLRDRRRRDAHDRDVAHPQHLAKPLGRLVGFQAYRVVGLHAQHQVHAALQIETKLQLLLHQPRRVGDAERPGDDRVDPHARENDQHRDNRDDFPANVSVHDELPLPSAATGSCPWYPTRETSIRTRSAICSCSA